MQQNGENNAEIIDFNNFKHLKEQVPQNTDSAAQNVNPEDFTPMLVWYPVWVMVPKQQFTPPTSSS